LNPKEIRISNFETLRVLDRKLIVLQDPQNEFESNDVSDKLAKYSKIGLKE